MTNQTLPVLPLRDIVVFPQMIVPLFVGRDKSVAALEAAMLAEKTVFLLSQRNPGDEDPGADELYDVGTVATVLQLLKLPDGTVKVLVEGQSRAELVKLIGDGEFLQAEVVLREDSESDPAQMEALLRSAVKQFESYVKLNRKTAPEIATQIGAIEDAGRFADTVAANLGLKIADKQALLGEPDVGKRLQQVFAHMEGEMGVLQVEKKIRNRVKRQMEKTQREYYLNEQMKAIQRELGEGDEAKDEVTEFEEKIAKAKLPKEARDKAISELKKFKAMAPQSAEATVVRNYLDVMLGLPWAKKSKVKRDIVAAQKILDDDHYGLEKVKDRIIEYLAVQVRTSKLKGPILCLVGPPGVGKTSLGRSIAKATGREFVRQSLGGMRDEAEIRGHRRTYIGSMPGKVIQNLKKAGTGNPLFLLDEIDKLGQDFRGDPSSALLEVLDPEQNKTFNDHYLEVDYDLSDVMFVTTANSLNMPQALLDRMEIIQLSGYTEDEKINIAERYLVQKQLKVNGIKDDELAIAESAIRDIVRYYTREAGVRSLEREISKICRKAVKALLLKKRDTKISVTSRNLEKYLGVRRFSFGIAEKNNQVGQVTGLAWTEVGGELLTIEAVSLPGRGKMTTTGKLGEVMQESIQAALSVVRSRARKLGIQEDFYQKRDIHIHLPEGATPKDGPSAGVAICTAMVSILTNIPVRADVAMTGEITLRGEVLPIGGLKEKLLAAHRGGIKTVLIPQENVKDLTEIPDNIKNKLDIHPVKWIDQVLELALEHVPEPLKDEPDAETPAIAVPEADKTSTVAIKH